MNVVLPEPYQINPTEGKFRITSDLLVTYLWKKLETNASKFVVAEKAVTRMMQRLSFRTNIWFDISLRSSFSKLFTNELIVSTEVEGDMNNIKLNMSSLSQEGYQIEIMPQQVLLKGNSHIGVVRGVETLLQLLCCDEEGFYWPCLSCVDYPRFPWRGLMIDVCFIYYDYLLLFIIAY